MCLARGVVGEWMRGLALGTGGVLDGVSVLGLRWCGWCRLGVASGIGPGSGGVGWCYVSVRCQCRFSV